MAANRGSDMTRRWRWLVLGLLALVLPILAVSVVRGHLASRASPCPPPGAGPTEPLAGSFSGTLRREWIEPPPPGAGRPTWWTGESEAGGTIEVRRAAATARGRGLGSTTTASASGFGRYEGVVSDGTTYVVQAVAMVDG